ncbi:XkdX family protein [Ruminococcus sp.]|uniref:XkdX family protein n=1 Tax=Ruminococcus sp. TaxID=41978 RepID=UPI003AB35F7E
MSKNYAKVKRYYDNRLWSAAMVHTAVGKWITAEEYETITKEVYHEAEVSEAH